jgi:hypothetical protein
MRRTRIAGDNWNRPDPREGASRTGIMAKRRPADKVWSHVGRMDNVLGDRNPV